MGRYILHFLQIVDEHFQYICLLLAVLFFIQMFLIGILIVSKAWDFYDPIVLSNNVLALSLGLASSAYLYGYRPSRHEWVIVFRFACAVCVLGCSSFLIGFGALVWGNKAIASANYGISIFAFGFSLLICGKIVLWEMCWFYQHPFKYDIFLSYRKSKTSKPDGTQYDTDYPDEKIRLTDERIADKLKNILESYGIRVFMDKSELTVGQEWEEGLTKAISSSLLFVPLISRESIKQQFENFKPNDLDFVLWEYFMALTLTDLHRIHGIVPVFIGREIVSQATPLDPNNSADTQFRWNEWQTENGGFVAYYEAKCQPILSKQVLHETLVTMQETCEKALSKIHFPPLTNFNLNTALQILQGTELGMSLIPHVPQEPQEDLRRVGLHWNRLAEYQSLFPESRTQTEYLAALFLLKAVCLTVNPIAISNAKLVDEFKNETHPSSPPFEPSIFRDIAMTWYKIVYGSLELIDEYYFVICFGNFLGLFAQVVIISFLVSRGLDIFKDLEEFTNVILTVTVGLGISAYLAAKQPTPEITSIIWRLFLCSGLLGCVIYQVGVAFSILVDSSEADLTILNDAFALMNLLLSFLSFAKSAYDGFFGFRDKTIFAVYLSFRKNTAYSPPITDPSIVNTDEDIAKKIAEILIKCGINVFLDEYEDTWENAQLRAEALSKSILFIPIISREGQKAQFEELDANHSHDWLLWKYLLAGRLRDKKRIFGVVPFFIARQAPSNNNNNGTAAFSWRDWNQHGSKYDDFFLRQEKKNVYDYQAKEQSKSIVVTKIANAVQEFLVGLRLSPTGKNTIGDALWFNGRNQGKEWNIITQRAEKQEVSAEFLAAMEILKALGKTVNPEILSHRDLANINFSKSPFRLKTMEETQNRFLEADTRNLFRMSANIHNIRPSFTTPSPMNLSTANV